jgi:hypothetical protein
MYLEIPLLAATVLSLLAWTRGKPIRAALWAAVAVLVKETGVIVWGALLLAAILDRSRRGAHPLRTVVMLAGPLAVLIILAVLASQARAPGFFSDHFRLMAIYLMNVPDLLYLLLLFIPFSLMAVIRESPDNPAGQRGAVSMFAVMISFLGFFVVLPIVGDFPVLIRYYVQITPFILVGLFATMESRLGPSKTTGWLVCLLVYFLVNSNGRFYPAQDLNDFSVQERSGGYVDLLELHQKGIRELEDIEAGYPVYYSQPVHYRLHYPQMGYAKGPLSNGYCIIHEEPYRQGRLSDFPPEFFMLYDYAWLGGEIIRDVREQAEADGDWIVESYPIVSGGFRSELIHIRRLANRDEVRGLE